MDYKKYLTQDVLAFWLKHAIDTEYGGIFTQLERDGSIYGTEKSVWFQGRALWTFSKAYNFIDQNPAYLDAARTIYEFLPKCTDTDGRMFYTVTREGVKIQKRRYYFSETFAAIGCAQYYRATKSPEAWERAQFYFNTARKLFEAPSLVTPEYNLDLKEHSPAMIMIATARAMAECAPDGQLYESLARKYTEELLDAGFVSEKMGALFENISTNGEFIDTPTGRCLNPGHALETAWFLMVEGLLTKNERALSTAKRIIDFTMPRGIDTEHGGIISFCDVFGKPPSALDWDIKRWWPQNEAIIANRMAYEIFGEKKYRESYQALLAFAMDHFADREYGEWYGYLHYDSTPYADLKGNIYKGPFHLPRMLMVLDAIENDRLVAFFS